MGKYWNKLWKSSLSLRSTKSTSNKEMTPAEKLDLALQEINHLKMRVTLLEHTLEQQLVRPPSEESTYNYFPTSSMYSTKSLPRYLHHNTRLNIPPSPDITPTVITIQKGASVKASVQRHRSLGEPNKF